MVHAALVMNDKHILKSKTVWVMVIMFLAGFFPAVKEYIGGAGGNAWVLQVVTGIGVLMRLITRDGVVLFSEDDDEDKGSKSDKGSTFPGLLLGILCMGSLLGGLMTSCTPQQMEAVRAVPIKGCYLDKNGNRVCYSSKGGLEVDYQSAK